MRLVFLREALRQWALTLALGQQVCSIDHRFHAEDRLPCKYCKAAI